VLVEWADRVENWLPAERVEIHVEVTGPESRRFEIIPKGDRYEAIFSQKNSPLFSLAQAFTPGKREMREDFFPPQA